MKHKRTKRQQTRGEEIANSISHGIGFLGAIAATVLLIMTAVNRGHGNFATLVGASVFGATMILLYLSSTLYHALPHDKGKHIFELMDHAAIYLLIAGSYTPLTVGVLRGSLGWTLFGLVWGLAIFGVVFKSAGKIEHPVLSTGLYLLMGWLIVIAIKTLWLNMSVAGLAWLIAGGLSYTVGVVFYAAHHVRYAHFVWHLFVMIGTACHCFAVATTWV